MSSRGRRASLKGRKTWTTTEITALAKKAVGSMTDGSPSPQLEDLVHLLDPSEECILETLRLRWAAGFIYTNLGNMLVSVNPYRDMTSELYLPDTVASYVVKTEDIKKTKESEVGENHQKPHIYSLAYRAYIGIRRKQGHQALIISGESGAGKTEATKRCLQYFAASASGGGDSSSTAEDRANTELVNKRVLASNPILEAFGNAKTVRNDNSSRFGKFMELLFDCHSGIMLGCTIRSYLLEKSRIASVSPSERSFHIFYQLSEGADADLKHQLHLKPYQQFHYLAAGISQLGGLSSPSCFDETKDAMLEVGIDAGEQYALYKVVAAVLQLGNVTFEEVEQNEGRITVDGMKHVEQASSLIGYAAPHDKLTWALCNRSFEVRRETMVVKLTAAQAMSARDALAKALFAQLFDWLVLRLNRCMPAFAQANDAERSLSVGILDIFGFEIFDENSFEQLCINFANEKLQQLFTVHTFKLEEDLYMSEGVKYTPCNFADNSDILAMIESKRGVPGIMLMLDEEVVMPKGCDATFLNKITSQHSKDPHFASGSGSGGGKSMHLKLTDFSIQHYAGKVTYNSTGFLDKNKDELHPHLRQLLSESTDTFIAKELFGPAAEPPEASTSRSGGKKKKSATVCQKFRTQLDQLIDNLKKREQHYVRCVKPNSRKQHNRFNDKLVLEQLKYCGIFEAVAIRQNGFPFRLLHAAFSERYRHLGTGDFGDVETPAEDLVRNLTEKFSTLKSIQFGRTMVLCRAEEMRVLERERFELHTTRSTYIQKNYRASKDRARAKIASEVRSQARDALLQNDIPSLEAALKYAQEQNVRVFELIQVDKSLKRLYEERRIKALLSEALAMDPLQEHERLRQAIEEAERIHLDPTNSLLVEAQAIYASIQDRVQAITLLQEGTATANEDMLREGLELAASLHVQWGDFCATETKAAQKTLKVIAEEKQLLSRLRAVVMDGAPSFDSKGDLHISAKMAAALERQLRVVETHGVVTREGKRLVKETHQVIEIRQCLDSGMWAQLESVLNEHEQLGKLSGGADVEESTKRDVRVAREELIHHVVAPKLVNGLLEGAATGQVGKVEITPVGITLLEECFKVIDALNAKGRRSSITSTGEVQEGAECGPRIKMLQPLIREARFVIKLRKALLKRDMGTLKQGLDSMPGSALTHSQKEVDLIRDELYDRSTKQLFHENLQDGMPEYDEMGDILMGSTHFQNLLDVRHQHETYLSAHPSRAYSDGLKRLYNDVAVVVDVRRLLTQQEEDPLGTAERVLAVVRKSRDIMNGNTKVELRAVGTWASAQRSLLLLKDNLANCRLTGTVGHVDGSRLDFVGMDAVIGADGSEESEELGQASSWNQELGQLVEVARVVRRLRLLMQKRQWEAAGEVLHLQEATLGGCDLVSDEIRLMTDEVSNLQLLATFTDALSNGRLPSDVSASAVHRDKDEHRVDITLLERSLALAQELGIKTDHAALIFECVQFVYQLRQGCLAKDWLGSIPELLAAAPNLHLHGHALILDEVHNFKEETKHHQVVSLLTAALAVGGPVGEPGGVIFENIQTEDLKEANAWATSVGCQSEEGIKLLRTSKIVQRLRVALKSQAWDRMMQDPFGSILKRFQRQEWGGISGGQTSGAAAGKCTSGSKPVATSGAKSSTTSGKKAASPAMGKGNGEVAPDPLEQLATCAYEELQIISNEWEINSLRNDILAALTAGRPSGTVGDLCKDTIIVDRFEGCFIKAASLCVQTSHFHHLVKIANIIWTIRSQILEDNWKGIARAIDDVHREEVAQNPYYEHVRQEVMFVEAELKHQNLLDAFGRAFKEGLGKEAVGDRDFSSIDTQALENSLQLAEKVGCRNYKARTLFILAQHLLRIRKALKEATVPNWTLIGEYLQAIPSTEYFSIVSKEVQQVENELNDHHLQEDFVAALSTGGPAGAAGQLDCRSIDTDLLEQAVFQYNANKSDGEVSSTSTRYVALVSFILRLRTSVRQQDWDAVGDFIHEFETLTSTVNLNAPKETAQEVLLTRTELIFQHCLLKLGPPLVTGCISGQVGALDIEAVDLHLLAGAINECGMHYRNDATDMLLDVAELVLRLRKAVVESDHERLRAEHQKIEDVLAVLVGGTSTGAEADGEGANQTRAQRPQQQPQQPPPPPRRSIVKKDSDGIDAMALLQLLPKETVRELKLAQHEIDDLRTMESLRRLLRAPGQIPSVAESVTSISLSKWKAMIATAPLSKGLSQMAINPKQCTLLSAASQKLFNCAHAICDVRKYAQDNNWFAVNTLYTSVAFEGMCDTVLLEELTNIQDNLSIRGMQFTLQNAVNTTTIDSINHYAQISQHDFKRFHVELAAAKAESRSALGELQGAPGGKSSPTIRMIVKETEQLILHADVLLDLRKRVMLSDWAAAAKAANTLLHDLNAADQTLQQVSQRTEPLISLCTTTVSDEVQRVLHTVQYKRDTDSCLEGLRISCLEADMPKLRSFLEMAGQLQLFASPDLGITSKIVNATHFHGILVTCTRFLHDGTRSNNIAMLKRGLEIAATLHLHGGSIDGVAQAKLRLQSLSALRKDVKVALRNVDVVCLKQLLKQAADENLVVHGLEEARHVLSKSEEFQAQLRLKTAILQNDVELATGVTTILKDRYLVKDRERFSDFWQFPNLRKKGALFIWEAVSQQDAVPSIAAPLTRSLTKLPAAVEKTALSLSRKFVMGATGIVVYSYPEQLVHDLLVTGKSSSADLRDEIYCQIIRLLVLCDHSLRKQLLPFPGTNTLNSDGGDDESRDGTSASDRAWKLLRFCLRCFPPGPCLECYLEAFLRKFGDKDLVMLLHKIVVLYLMPFKLETEPGNSPSLRSRSWLPSAQEVEAAFHFAHVA
jgi:myosin heavy subunit